ncbi:MAG: sigma-70 family RNA polymerase sigma factor [Planctomycetes bacterium]|nr:sigma-70 family RNA polymerase sigma factor [Planctomycetota bacterium]
MLAAAGRSGATDEILPLVYDELRRIAAARLAKTPSGNTLQPTALVHEAYLRLVGSNDTGWNGRRHFFAAAARAIRDTLVEQARRKARLKYGGERERVDLDVGQLLTDRPAEDVLAVDEALRKLESTDARAAKVVELRCFAGLSEAETAAALGASERTVRREWVYARNWLKRELTRSRRQE